MASASEGRGRFAATRWSVVVRAGAADADARDALSALCETYWYPLYAWARRSGLRTEDARDATQDFFARLIEKRDFRDATPVRGRFRSYLLGAFRNFLANRRAAARALKRGGDRAVLSLDFAGAEERLALEPAADAPERVYERDWARALVDTSFDDLRAAYAARGEADLFDALRPALAGDGAGPPRATLALELGLGEGALKVAIHRLRKRFRDRLLTNVRATVDAPEDAADELAALFRALGA